MVDEDVNRGNSNWALLGEIQAEGLRAAGALVERLVHLVDGAHPTPTDDPRDDGPAGIDMGAVLPWFELWRDLVERTSDTLQRFNGAARGPSGEGVQVGIDGSLAPTQPLTVTVGLDGRGLSELWLHNGTPHEQGELVPRCGPLTDASGTVLECDVDIDPPKIDNLPSKSSRGFAISVRVEPPQASGTYRGIVQVRGADAVWMPIEIVIPVRPA